VSLILSRYRDVPYEETRCEHVTPIKGLELSIQRWQEIRGIRVTLIAETYKRGECDWCDSWFIEGTDPRRCAIRRSLEMD
jgi:hypothetical protein